MGWQLGVIYAVVGVSVIVGFGILIRTITRQARGRGTAEARAEDAEVLRRQMARPRRTGRELLASLRRKAGPRADPPDDAPRAG